MSVLLLVHTPDVETFDAYYYGYGEVVSQEVICGILVQVVFTTINFGNDRYRAEYQAGRFASGLYFAEVHEG